MKDSCNIMWFISYNYPKEPRIYEVSMYIDSYRVPFAYKDYSIGKLKTK